MSKDTRYIYPFPPVVRIEPAASCNFKCIHCPTGLDMSPTGLMSMETFEKIVSNLKAIIEERQKRLKKTGERDYPESPLFRLAVLYFGGEPMLNKHFFRMVRQSKKLAVMVKTITNGSRLDDQTIEELISSGLDYMEISIDGVSAQENDSIRINSGGSTFASISENVIKLIQRRKAHGSKTPRIFISNTQLANMVEELARPPQPPLYMLEVFEQVSSDISYKPTWAMTWPGVLVKSADRPKINFCDHITNTISIRCNGDVVPCCYDLTTKMPMGNIHDQRLEVIWNNWKFRDIRHNIDEYSPPPLCFGCPVLYQIQPLLKNDIFPEK